MMRAAAVLNLLSLIFFFSILLIGIIFNLKIKEQIPDLIFKTGGKGAEVSGVKYVKSFLLKESGRSSTEWVKVAD